jgi:hypothetical protein
MNNKKNHPPTLEELRTMLRDECDLRNSTLVQNIYDDVSVDFNRTEEVEDFVQAVIIARSRFPHLSIKQYRDLLYANREALKDDAFFIKYNIMTGCPINAGEIISSSAIDSLTLHHLDLETIKFRNILSSTKKNVFIASSST